MCKRLQPSETKALALVALAAGDESIGACSFRLVIEWLKDFRPDDELRAFVLASLRGAARRSDVVAIRRRELIRELNRLRDLYIIEDLSKSEYLLRRQAIEEQLERAGMPLDPRLDKAEEALAEFGRKFWNTETEAAERRRLVAALIDRVWQDKGLVVAVKPREPFMRYFKAADELAQRRARNSAVISGSDGGRSVNLHTTTSRSGSVTLTDRLDRRRRGCARVDVEAR